MSEESRKAKLRALRILTRVDKTEADLRAGLERAGFSSESVEEAVEYVRSYGYIDDQRYAEKYVAYNKGRKSKLKIKYELMQKGVSKACIDLALELYEDYDAISAIRIHLKRKWKKDERPNEKELNKLIASLLRQGFSSHDIWHVLREENLT